MEISIREFFYLMLDKLYILILCAVIGFAGFYGYAKITEIPSYTCEVTMIVNASPDTAATSGTIKASQDLAKAYIGIMKDYSFSEKIAESLPKKSEMSINQIRKSLSMEAVDESQILAVSVTTTSKENSYNIAKVIEEIAPTVLRRYFDDTGTIVILNDAKMPTTANASSVKIKGVIGAVIGFAVAAGVLLLIAKLDKRIRTEEDIAVSTNYPVLGTIGSVE